MSQFVFKLPDLGEGTVEAEIVAWRVKPGDAVNEDDVVAEVMTEKAVIEVPAPVTGKVVSVAGEPGDKVPVGAALIVFDTNGEAAANAPAATAAPERALHVVATTDAPKEAPVIRKGRVLTSPAIRRRAREANVDLTTVAGSGPNGRILRKDLEATISGGGARSTPAIRERAAPVAPGTIEEVKVIGLRRVIAQRMAETKRNIPHFAYVEEVDITELEELRKHLNSKRGSHGQLTYLPFLVVALTRILPEFPQCNALYDSERGVLLRHSAVHAGIATQTPDGLKVPVVRDAQAKSLWEIADEIRAVSEAARTNKATREQLSGSTITVTSLGKLGGIASTPIINAPEMAIIGVNRAVERPVVRAGAIAIRRMMNLSSSFDHRFVDGFDAAALIQALKERLEHPATIFIAD